MTRNFACVWLLAVLAACDQGTNAAPEECRAAGVTLAKLMTPPDEGGRGSLTGEGLNFASPGRCAARQPVCGDGLDVRHVRSIGQRNSSSRT